MQYVIRECVTFLGFRLTTFIIETALLILLVKVIKMNDFIAKCIVNIVVIIINYVLSKIILFKK
ncbi:hypothetical protein FC764_05970 [Clostridium botulinum]|nr:hypothetical protein [Clostridium botulinum]